MSNQSMLGRAKQLREQADRLELLSKRKLPAFWKVGMKVRYLKDSEWAWRGGDTAYVKQLRSEYAGTPADTYQVFYTGPLDGGSIFWTTPDDVELVEEVNNG